MNKKIVLYYNELCLSYLLFPIQVEFKRITEEKVKQVKYTFLSIGRLLCFLCTKVSASIITRIIRNKHSL